MNETSESGHEFEQRAISIARALHDPMGTQGSEIVDGRERDGLFINHTDIHAYECTTHRSKDKATKDGEKLANLLKKIGDHPGNALKTRTGWFVTREEPTADQRTEIGRISQKHNERINAVSISTLFSRICNAEEYLQVRDRAPFGSIEFTAQLGRNKPLVDVELIDASGEKVPLSEVANLLQKGGRALITGDYGVGKSHSLREIYQTLRKRHFRTKGSEPFPVHINLRDCVGLKTPAEILRRHSEEVGFSHSNGLVSAWRAGSCVLLLDGFDEIIPSRWVGTVRDLKSVRWEALSSVRRLVHESPQGAGIVVAGRAQYFSGTKEMSEALGFSSSDLFRVPDFTENQVNDFLSQSGVDWQVPEWMPLRPLLLGYLVSMALEEPDKISFSTTRARGWRSFVRSICEREARMFTAVRPETIAELISRVATLARSQVDATGPVTTQMLDSAYSAVNGVQPDEEGRQLLLRLPGLASQSNADSSDTRVFVDRDLADTAYGLDLAKYVSNQSDSSHALNTDLSWSTAASDLGIEVAVDELEEKNTPSTLVANTILERAKKEQFDAVTADLVRLAAELTVESRRPIVTEISGVYFPILRIPAQVKLSSISVHDCVIEQLDMSEVDESSQIPTIQNCIIGEIVGLSSIPEWIKPNLVKCEVSKFSNSTQTTSGIMQLDIDRESRIALSILKKVYGQRGSARKEGALSRGLKPNDRESVPSIIDQMVSDGWIVPSTAGRSRIYSGTQARRKAALQALDRPEDFRL